VSIVRRDLAGDEPAGSRSPPGPAGGAANGRRWLGVEFRHLGALAAVAREGSFRRAAESLGYVQSAISGQIAQLERAVGVQLVERSHGSGGATLTPAGEVLLSHVDEILARFEAARVDLRALANGSGEIVRVGVLDGIGQRRLPTILEMFEVEAPATQVVVDESLDDDRNFARLASGELDLMITELPLPTGPFTYTLLERDEYVLVVAADSPLARQPEPPSIGQLTRLPLILPAPTRTSDLLAARLRESLIDQSPWLRPHSSAAAQALAAAGLGAAILPRLAVDLDDEMAVIVRLPSLLPARLIALVRHREREYSPAARAFIKLAETSFHPCSGTARDDAATR
jgi:molybdate transport repressor ModE-like protein